MYALIDKEHPETTALTDYFRTHGEAVEAMVNRTKTYSDGRVLIGEEYLEIVEIERESRPCRYCGGEIQSTKPDVDFCRGCFYVGRTQDEHWPEIYDALKALEGVRPESVGVWHTGGGCFAIGAVIDIDGVEHDILVADDASIPDPAEKPDATFGACLDHDCEGWCSPDNVPPAKVGEMVQTLIDRARKGDTRDF
jgi:hypothetical protein